MNTLFDLIYSAHHDLRPHVAITPLSHSMGLSEISGCEVYLKCEHLLTTGSFKFRGASNKFRLLSVSARKEGVIAASSGNHGKAVALAGKMAGVPVTVYTTTKASPVKLQAITQYGAHLITLDATSIEVEIEARRQAQLQGKVFISPYNDLEVIAGQGTIGMELMEQCMDAHAIFASVGGGGLISGVATAIKSQKTDTQIIGCWPANANSLFSSLKAGKIIAGDEYDTLSDGTAGEIESDSITFPLCQQLIDDTLLVTEEDIRSAMKSIAHTDQWIIEGAAGVAVAGMLKKASHYQGKKVIIILCGRNINFDKYLDVVS